MKHGCRKPLWNLDYRGKRAIFLKATKTKVPESIMPTWWKVNTYSMTLTLREKDGIELQNDNITNSPLKYHMSYVNSSILETPNKMLLTWSFQNRSPTYQSHQKLGFISVMILKKVKKSCSGNNQPLLMTLAKVLLNTS